MDRLAAIDLALDAFDPMSPGWPDFGKQVRGLAELRALRADLAPETSERTAVHRYRPCSQCDRAPDVHNANRPDWIGHEYR